jgi:glucose-1-phosphate cytidylyltransferase
VKVIILAGGFGTRLSELTGVIPKPMVPVGGRPILTHIMGHYARYGFNDFYIALGYKAEVIKDYFLRYSALNTNFTVSLQDGSVSCLGTNSQNWRVTLIDTGLQTMTGGRAKRMQAFMGSEPCFLTYGDGLSDINIKDLLNFHEAHGRMITVSAVRPPARFGELELDGPIVKSFKEKPQLQQGWINGGFFVIQPEFFDLIQGDEIMLEREPLECAAQMGQLMAYKHEGFWQCMDTKRDHDLLEALWINGAPWNPKE